MGADATAVLMIVAVLAAAGSSDRETSPEATTSAAETSGSPGVPVTVTSPAGAAPADAQAPAVTAGESRYLTEALQRGMGQIELARAMFETNLRQARTAYAQVTVVVPPQTPEAGSVPAARAGTALLGLFAVRQRLPLGWTAVVIGVVGAVRPLRQQRGPSVAGTRDGHLW